MKSIRKIGMLVAAFVAVVAVVLPAVASAARLEEPAGKLLSKGTKFSAVTTNLIFHSSWGDYGCAEMNVPGEVTKNDGTSVIAVGMGLGTNSTCKLNKTQAITIEEEIVSLNLFGPNSGSMNVKYTHHLPGGAICNIEGALPTYYSPGTNVLSVRGNPKAGACGPMLITGDYRLTDVNTGQPIVLN